MKKLSTEGTVLLALACVLLAAVAVGLVRHLPKAKVEFVPLERAAMRIPLNKAEAEELLALPGIGPGLASRIVAYRDTHGVFLAPESLLNVPGIGRSKLEEIKPYLEVP